MIQSEDTEEAKFFKIRTDSDSIHKPSTQIDYTRSSSSSDSDEFSEEESYSSSEESIIDLEKLRREQVRLTLLKKISENSKPEFMNKGKMPEKVDESNDSSNASMLTSYGSMPTSMSDYSDNEEQTYYYLISQPCPLGVPHKPAVQMLKIRKNKPSTKEFSPPVSHAVDGSAWIPEINRTKLPIESRRRDIVSIIRENRVIVLSGSTGCGKSTQVPQYILDDCLQRRVPVNIICTQPRRIAATSLAHRVASERGTPLHGQIGYHIGGKGGFSASTRLRYVTTGILLEMLKADRYLNSYTHVIMDEIHERNVDDDLMMAHLCVILRENPSLKLIIMSATMNVQKFTRYFCEFETENDGFVSQIPWIDIPAKTFPVDVFYLEDVCQGVDIYESYQKIVLSNPKKPSMMQERRDLFISWILRCHIDSPVGDAFLVFVPGIALIAEMEDQLMLLSEQQRTSTLSFPDFTIIKLHSTVTIDEQCLVMQRPRNGCRKIILATNVAESSITVPDVRIIFDSCLRKDVHYDKTTRSYSLNEQWISKDCAEQRRGRAGRVGPGVIYRFVPKQFFDSLSNERNPEIKRTPLNSLLLRSIYANLGDPRELLSHCLDPPDDTAVDYAIEDLEATGAVIKSSKISKEVDDWIQGSVITYEYEVTRLGAVLAQLPLDLHSGLLVVYGAIFGSLYDTMVIAAILQNRGVIVQPLNQEIQISAAMSRFSRNLPDDFPIQGGSDLISHLRGYLYWEETTQHDNKFDLSKELSWCQNQFISLYWMREIQDLVISIRESLAYMGICSPPAKEERDKIRRNRNILNEFESNEEFESDNIDQAIRILDIAVYDETPDMIKFDEINEGQEKPPINTYRTRSKPGTPVHQIPDHVRALLNPWTNVFDRKNEISSRPVKLNREPNVTLLTILLTATFHQNLFRVTPSQDNRVFKNCPRDFNRNHTIEFSAQILPPKDVIIEALQKDIGFVHKIVHPGTESSETQGECESCYIEFVKPAKPIWIHSRDRNKSTLPDAVFLAQKLRTVKNGIWTEGLSNSNGCNTTSTSYSEDTKKLRFSGISGCSETATGLSPIFRSKSSRVYPSKTSLYFPLIIDGSDHKRYSICAGKLLAVDYGHSHVAEHITCLIGPLRTRNNIGDAILAFFANKVEHNDVIGGWHVQINLTQYPLFHSRPSEADLDLIHAVRYFLRQALFETKPISLNSNDNCDYISLSNLTRKEMVNFWSQCKMTADQAGKLLVASVLMIL
ncbi:probable ATP-dependent RNA helicase spindle-E [Rhizophagus clarus]|uniref:Probable ATP-dependent RNA helicase spindle-E n=1 Tax=Rhizophagus clarus TaxID=94130 RepID=A0A8H3KXT1_9GLOM|nr:probable ATP-dependent RNA helicase spindle-E [Rhizophagus clarus]